MRFITFLLVQSAFTIYIAAAQHSASAEDIPLKCDGDDRFDYEESNDWFCTVSGLMLSHSQNLRIPRMAKANSVKFMKFYDSRLLYIPYGLFDVFFNLITLDVSATEILELPRNTFANAGNLTQLVMNNNNITELTTSVFVGASKLMRLDLSYNHIGKLSELAFSGLQQLDKVLLSFNKLTHISKDTFVENTYIEIIMLDHNQLEYVDAEVFKRLRHLREVSLAHNSLAHIELDTFAAAYNLDILVLSSNHLHTFSLANKSIASQLHLDDNHLTSICINGTKHVSASQNHICEVYSVNAKLLETLQLSRNNISDLTNITGIMDLLELDLSYNPIGPLNISTLSNMKRLRTLNLRATGIRKLDFGMFAKQMLLESLNLAFNNLTELNLDMFVPYCNNIRRFLVDGNNLSVIHGKHSWSMAFPNLQTLGISLNNFNCTYLHTQLTPPNLLSSVSLNIEPDKRDYEVSHIHDVSCVSDVKDSLAQAEQNLHSMAQLQILMQTSLEVLKINEQRLQLYMLLMKITLFSVITLVIVVFAVRLWQRRQNPTRAYFSNRSGGSIIFHSNPTINSIADH